MSLDPEQLAKVHDWAMKANVEAAKTGPRDPNRIGPLLALLGAYWRLHPDLRLGQIIGNAVSGSDAYYVEDFVLVEQLQAWLDAE